MSAAHLKFRPTSNGRRAPRLLECRRARMPAASALPDELFPACPAAVGWPPSSRLAAQIAAPPPGDIVRRPLARDTAAAAGHAFRTARTLPSGRLGWAPRTATALTRHMILVSTPWPSVQGPHAGASGRPDLAGAPDVSAEER
ncbi:unnamed protein product [Urochloa humidicola]